MTLHSNAGWNDSPQFADDLNSRSVVHAGFCRSCFCQYGVNPLYGCTHYNSKVVYNVILISTEWIFVKCILCTSKFCLMSKCSGTNCVKRVHCIC